MNLNYHCSKCGVEVHPNFYWKLEHRHGTNVYCSRSCMIEHVAPELSQAVVVKQWIPTAEENERMAQ